MREENSIESAKARAITYWLGMSPVEAKNDALFSKLDQFANEYMHKFVGCQGSNCDSYWRQVAAKNWQ